MIIPLAPIVDAIAPKIPRGAKYITYSVNLNIIAAVDCKISITGFAFLPIAHIAKAIYEKYPFDGKYIIDGDRLIICQSNSKNDDLKAKYPGAEVNPIGEWTGGTDVDTGATNRKLGSDMADSVTGGGLHGKDLSKADVSVNIYAFLKAQVTGKTVELCCAIGDETIDDKPYDEIVAVARKFIFDLGGFEKFAEWGLVIA